MAATNIAGNALLLIRAALAGNSLKDVGKDVERQGPGVGQRFGASVGRFAMTALGAMGVGVTAAKVFGGGLNRLMGLEDARAKLGGLGNDAATVERAMAGALASVKGTSFGLAEAANTAAGAVAAGIKPGEDLDRVLNIVAASAAAAGVGMDEMGSIFNKAATQVNGVQNDVISQLADRGIPIYEELGKVMGVTGGEVFKLASQGKVSFADFTTAAEAAAGDVAAAMGATTQGAISNFNASLGRIGANFLEGVFPLIQPALAQMTDWLGGVEDKAKIVGEVFGGWVTGTVVPGLQKVGDAVKAIWDLLSTGDFTGSIGAALGVDEDSALVGFLLGVRDTALSVWDELKGGVEAFGAAWSDADDEITSSGFPGVMERLAEFIKNDLIPGFQNTVKWISENTGVIKIIAGVIGTLLIPMFVSLGVQATASAVKQVAAWVTTRMQATASAASQVASHYRVVAGWVMSGAQAIKSGAQSAYVWGLYAADAIKGAATTVAQHARIAAAWVASRVTAVAEAGRAAVAWVVGSARTVAALAAQGAAFVAQRVVMLAQAAAAGTARLAQLALNAAMKANPIGLVITAVTALVGALVWFFTQTETGQKIWDAFTKGLVAGWEWLKAKASEIWSAITGWISRQIESLRSTIDSVMAAIRGVWDRGWSAISSAASTVWEGIKNVVRAGIDWVKNWISSTLTNIQTAWSSAWTTVRNLASTIWEGIKTAIRSAIDWVKNWIATTLTNIQTTWSNIWTAVRNTASNIWEGIKTAIRAAIDWVKNWISTTLSNIQTTWSSAWTTVRNLATSIWEGIKTAIRSAIDWVKNWITTTLSNIRSTWESVWNTIRNVASTVWEAIKTVIRSAWENGIKPAFDKITDGVNAVKNGFEKAREGIASAWDKLKGAVEEPIRVSIEFINSKLIGGINKILPSSLQIPKIPGFHDGGHTGNLPWWETAGVVHGDEHVIRARSRKRLERTAPGALDYMNETGQWPLDLDIRRAPGYAKGGRVWPLSGSKKWGTYRGHTGIDFPRPTGTPVMAASAGKVTSAPKLNRSYGWHVRQSASGGESIYAHLSKILVSVGQMLSAGQRLGNVGSTGNSTGPHLHFERRPPGTDRGTAAWLNGAATPSGSGGGAAVDAGPVEEKKSLWEWILSKISLDSLLGGGPSGDGGFFGRDRMIGLAKFLAGKIWDGIKQSLAKVVGVFTDGALTGTEGKASFDRGGLATGAGWLPKATREPERVLSPAQTKAFEDWMSRGPNTSGTSAGDGLRVAREDLDYLADRIVHGLWPAARAAEIVEDLAGNGRSRVRRGLGGEEGI